MENTAAVVAVCLCAVLLFPIHIDNYLYINKDEKYVSLNIVLYSFIRVFNINTVKNSPTKMQVNGRERNIKADVIKKNALKIVKELTLTKIVQLGDYGMQSENNAYAALMQSLLTNALYSYMDYRRKIKLKNFVILNTAHKNILHYAKISCVINIVTLLKILIKISLGRINEQIQKR